MRGWSNTNDRRLAPNSAAAEIADSASPNYIVPSATGFSGPTAGLLNDSSTYIYIAIRRGPMKVPTDATKVFIPVAQTTNTNAVVTTNFPVDLVINSDRPGGQRNWWDRLRGKTVDLQVTTSAELNYSPNGFAFDSNVNVVDSFNNGNTGVSEIYWNMRRAPGFFDVVCYTGTGVRPLQLNHNLGAVPELMIVKIRATAAQPWFVYSSALGNTNYLNLNTAAASATSISAWSNTTPTSTTFTVGDFDAVNGSTNYTYVAYLFATCPGVSKVGSYTGTGATQTINCGFTGGARFVLVKDINPGYGGWALVDTARGMVAGTDPFISLNNQSAESNSNNIYTVAGGFQLVSSNLNFNASGYQYIFLAIA